jgi:PD-(D/E)XK nuclease superfamily
MNKSMLPAGFIFSQSSLQDYSDCPQRFQLRYLDRLAWPAAEMEPALENERRQQEGLLFHRMVQQSIIGIPKEKVRTQAFTPNLQKWWENYSDHPVDLSGKRAFTEITLSATLPGGFRLVAKYDLLAIRPGEQIIIYDWKTYAKRPRDATMAVRWQTRIYPALLVPAGAQMNGGSPILPEQIMMMYWFADFPTEPTRLSYSSLQYQRDMLAIGNMVNEISEASIYPKTEDEKKCAYCNYRSYCERKVLPGKAEYLEDGLGEEDFSLGQIMEISF